MGALCAVIGFAGVVDARAGQQSAVCGDGIVGVGETCDDGNAQAADGCSATCHEETGFTCTGEPSTCLQMARTPVLTPVGTMVLILALGGAVIYETARVKTARNR